MIATNTALIDEPENIVNDPYGTSWLLKVNIEDPSELDDTMPASEYRNKVEGN